MLRLLGDGFCNRHAADNAQWTLRKLSLTRLHHVLQKSQSLEKRYTFCGKITKFNKKNSFLGRKNAYTVFEEVALFCK